MKDNIKNKVPCTSSQAIWEWYKFPDTEERRYNKLKNKAIIQAVIIVIIAIGLFTYNHFIPAVVLCILAASFVIMALLTPALFAKVDVFISKIAGRVGILLTWLFLVPFFYLVFPIGRLLIILTGKDSMRLKKDTTLKSNWFDKKDILEIERYGKQF